MGIQNQLLASRWTDALSVAGGPGINDLEAVLKLITGIPLATTITLGLGLNEKCAFAQPIRARGTASGGTNGLRLRDTTNSHEWLIQNIDGLISLYYNTGTEDTANWQFQGIIPMSCLCHVNNTSGDTVTSVTSSGATVVWNRVLHEDISTMWVSSPYPTRVTIPYDGYYKITGWGRVIGTGGTNDTQFISALKLNGTTVQNSVRPFHLEYGSSDQAAAFDFTHFMDLDQSDYLELLLSVSAGTENFTYLDMVVERVR